VSPRSNTKIEARKTTYFDKPPVVKKQGFLRQSKTVSPRAISPRRQHTDSDREYDSYLTPDSLSSGEEKIRLERLDSILARRSPRRRIRKAESLNSRRIKISTDGDFTTANPEFLKLLELQKKQSSQIKVLQQQLEKQARLIQLQNEMILSSGKQNETKITAIAKLQDQINNDKYASINMGKTKTVRKKTPKREARSPPQSPKKHASLRRNYQLRKRESEFEDTESSSIEREEDPKRRQEQDYLETRRRLMEEAHIKEAIKNKKLEKKRMKQVHKQEEKDRKEKR